MIEHHQTISDIFCLIQVDITTQFASEDIKQYQTSLVECTWYNSIYTLIQIDIVWYIFWLYLIFCAIAIDQIYRYLLIVFDWLFLNNRYNIYILDIIKHYCDYWILWNHIAIYLNKENHNNIHMKPGIMIYCGQQLLSNKYIQILYMQDGFIHTSVPSS